MADLSAVEEFVSRLRPAQQRAGQKPQARPARAAGPLAAMAIAAGLLLLAVAALAFVIWQFDAVQNTRRKAFEVALATKNLNIDLLDAETGQRGFVITHDAAFLQPFAAGTASARQSLADLRGTLAGQPGALASLDAVQKLWAQKLAEMQQTVDLVRAGQGDEASRRVADASGKGFMDGIRRELDSLAATSAATIAKAVQDAQMWRQYLLAFACLALAMALAIGAWQVASTGKLVQALRSHQAALADLNDNLETIVDLRTHSLQNVSALLASVTLATFEAIYAKDRDSRMIFANPACLEIIGLGSASVLGFCDAEFHDNRAEAEIVMAADKRIMATGIAETIEEAYTTPGGPRIFLSSKAPLKAADGAIIGIVGISTDITARKDAERQRHLSEQRFRAAVTAFDGIVWTANTLGEVVLAHPQWSALTGQSVEEAAGHGWSKMLHPDDIEPTRIAWTVCLAQKTPFVGEYRVRARDGEFKTMAVRAIPVLDENLDVTEWVGLNIDISGERDTQLRLQEALERVNLALEAAATGAWEIGAGNGARSYFDARVYEIWGLPRDASERDLYRARHPDDRAMIEAALAKLLESPVEDHVELEHRILRPDGEQRWVALRARAIVKAGQPTRVIGTVRDISLRKQQQERIGFLMQELTHRSKNALAVVQAIARQTSAKAASLPEFQKSFEARLNGMAQSLDLLVRHDWTAIDIKDLIKSQLQHHLDARQDKISFEGPQIWLKPEAAQNIGLALHELSTNAAKYGALSGEAGRIAIGWKIDVDAAGSDVFKMHWRESGGPAVETPKTRGFGHAVIHRVVKAALAGESDLQFDPEGLRWDLAIPVTHVVLAKGT